MTEMLCEGRRHPLLRLLQLSEWALNAMPVDLATPDGFDLSVEDRTVSMDWSREDGRTAAILTFGLDGSASYLIDAGPPPSTIHAIPLNEAFVKILETLKREEILEKARAMKDNTTTIWAHNNKPLSAEELAEAAKDGEGKP